MRALVALLCGAWLAGAASASELAWVSNERAGTVSAIDVVTDRVVATIDVGGRPRGIAASPNGRMIWVAVSRPRGGDPTFREGIVAIDATMLAPTVQVVSGSDPEGFALGARPRRLYVANEDAGTASIVDVTTGRVLTTLVVGVEPEGVAISRDGRLVYVTAETSNSVSVIDVEKRRVVASFLVDPRPRAAVFAHSGGLAFVTSEVGRAVSVVDVARNAVIGRLHFDAPEQRPVGVAISPDDFTLYVATGRADSVAVIDVANPREPVLATEIPVGQRPWGVGLCCDGRKLYTANGVSNDVSVIDTEERRRIATIPVGDGPWGIAIAPSPLAPGPAETTR